MNIGKILSLTVLMLLIINLISNNFKLDTILFCKILTTFLIFLYSSTSQIPAKPPSPPLPAPSPSPKREKSLSEKYKISDLPIKKLNFDTVENSPKEANSPLIIMEEPSSIQADMVINIPLSRKPSEKRSKPASTRSDSRKILNDIQRDRAKATQTHKSRLENLQREYEEMVQSSRLKFEVESLIKPASPIRVQHLQLPVILEAKESEAPNDFTPKLNQTRPEFKSSAETRADPGFNPRPLGSRPLEQSALEVQLKSLGDVQEDKNGIPPHMLLPVYKVKPYATQDPILRTPTSVDQPAFRPNPLSQSSFPAGHSGQMSLSRTQESFAAGSSGFFVNAVGGNAQGSDFRNIGYAGPALNNFTGAHAASQFGNSQVNPFATSDNRNSLSSNVNPFPAEANKFQATGNVGTSNGNAVGGFPKSSQYFENKEASFAANSNRGNPFPGFGQLSEPQGFKSAVNSRPNPFDPAAQVPKPPAAVSGFNVSNQINPFGASAVQGYSTPVNPFGKNSLSDGGKSRISDFSQASLHSSHSSAGPSTFQHNPTPRPNPNDFLNLPLSSITLEIYKQIRSQIPFQDRAVKEAAESLLLFITDLYPTMSEHEFKSKVESINSIFSNFPPSKLSILSVNFAYLVLDNLLDYNEDSQTAIKFSEYFAKIFIHLDRLYKSLTTLLVFEVQSQFSIFAGAQLSQKEVHESWQLEDLKKRKQGGELQKSVYVEMRNVEVLTIFYMVLMVEMGQVERIREFVAGLQSCSREVLPLMVGVLICLSRNPRLLVAGQVQGIISEHGKRFEELHKICNVLFFNHEVVRFKDLYNKLYGFS